MADDVILAKAEIIERCLRRVEEQYAGDPTRLRDDYTVQDSIILNLQRACQAAIDLALRVVRVRTLGLPKESREAFELLQHADLLEPQMAARLKRMVGFRNLTIHDYQAIDWNIVQAVIEREIVVLRDLSRLAVQQWAA